MKWFHCTVGDDVINTKNKSAGIKLMIKMSKWTNNSRRSSGKERLANNSHYWNGLATIAIGESLQESQFLWLRLENLYESQPLSLIMCASSMMNLPSLYFWLDSNACSCQFPTTTTNNQSWKLNSIELNRNAMGQLETVLKSELTENSNVIVSIYFVSFHYLDFICQFSV